MSKTGGNWIKTKREERGLLQRELAQRAGLSTSYISTLERGQKHSITGADLRPEPAKLNSIAKALSADANELLALYGYASSPSKPQSLSELLERLEALGIENLHFADHDAWRSATPDQLQELLDAVQVAVNVTLNRLQKNNDPPQHSLPEPL